MRSGLELRTAAGKSRSLAPFVTRNHPLLGSSGQWLAASPADAQAELDGYVPNSTLWAGKPYTPPVVGQLETGTAVLMYAAAAAAAAAGSGGGGAVVSKGMVEALTAEKRVVEAEEAEARAVYSLELEVADLAVYAVNGVLVMD